MRQSFNDLLSVINERMQMGSNNNNFLNITKFLLDKFFFNRLIVGGMNI